MFVCVERGEGEKARENGKGLYVDLALVIGTCMCVSTGRGTHKKARMENDLEG